MGELEHGNKHGSGGRRRECAPRRPKKIIARTHLTTQGVFFTGEPTRKRENEGEEGEGLYEDVRYTMLYEYTGAALN
jgi:hypothetical protein